MYRLVRPALLLIVILVLGALVIGRSDEAAAQSGTRPGYSPAPPPPRDLPVTLVIRLPAEALLDIEGVRTKLTGEMRRFRSPPLPIGPKYVYTLRGTWKMGDQDVVRERKLEVRAGAEVTVDLRNEPAPKSDGKPK